MNILVIGNGFDLEHGLPTTYKDFLDFLKNPTDFLNKEYISKDGYDEILRLCSNNFWVEYFINLKLNLNCKDDTWVEFESMIAEIIKAIQYYFNYEVSCRRSFQPIARDRKMEAAFKDLRELPIKLMKDLNLQLQLLDSKIVEFGDTTKKLCIIYNNIVDHLDHDFDKFIKCLAIYFGEYIEKLHLDVKCPDIESLNIDCVLNFNYTSTFARLYDTSEMLDYHYIHGQCIPLNLALENNMVLGIDECLARIDEDMNSKVVKFEKFFQSIYKETGSRYHKWLRSQTLLHTDEFTLLEDSYPKREITTEITINEISKKTTGPNNVIYFFGHSLDVTDKEILRELLLNKESIKVIFYHNSESKYRLMVNLLNLIGQDGLSELYYSDNPKIFFEQQKSSVLRCLTL